MDIEQAELEGIEKASNAAASDVFTSTGGAAATGDGVVGVASRPQAVATAATKMSKYPRTLS